MYRPALARFASAALLVFAARPALALPEGGAAKRHAQTAQSTKRADPLLKVPAPKEGGAKGPPAKAGGREGRPATNTEAVRRAVAGAPTVDEVAHGAESPELRALREAEREVFLPAAPRPGAAWPAELAFPGPINPRHPVIHASGLPPAPPPERPDAAAPPRDAAWVRSLKMPELHVRFDARVVQYLTFFRDDPRGRATAALATRRAGRYGDVVRKSLRAEGVPEELLWVAMAESAFDPGVHSPAGAAGLWQFMPDGARVYGLRVERWVDERLDPVAASAAAAKYLSDLHRRFGTWELALAAYNMGYGGLLAAERKYNTNDFWELSRFEAGIPWETTLYVPKIIALAVVAENRAAFGLEGIEPDAPMRFDEVKVKGGVSFDTLGKASSSPVTRLEELNPHLRAKRTPPDPPGAREPMLYPVRVPLGRGDGARARLETLAPAEPALARHAVRFGQTAESIATELGVARASLLSLNGMTSADVVRAGDVLLVPPESSPRAALGNERPVVVVPRAEGPVAGKRRLFYRVVPGDTLRAIAGAFGVRVDDLRASNAVDPAARLQEGMTLQIFVEPNRDLGGVVALRDDEARVLPVGSDAFFTWFEAQKGRRRIEVKVGQRDTWESIARRYGCSVGTLERINRRGRNTPLSPDETLVVYAERRADDAAPGRVFEAIGPLTAPHPEDLPAGTDLAAPASPAR